MATKKACVRLRLDARRSSDLTLPRQFRPPHRDQGGVILTPKVGRVWGDGMTAKVPA